MEIEDKKSACEKLRNYWLQQMAEQRSDAALQVQALVRGDWAGAELSLRAAMRHALYADAALSVITHVTGMRSDAEVTATVHAFLRCPETVAAPRIEQFHLARAERRMRELRALYSKPGMEGMRVMGEHLAAFLALPPAEQDRFVRGYAPLPEDIKDGPPCSCTEKDGSPSPKIPEDFGRLFVCTSCLTRSPYQHTHGTRP